METHDVTNFEEEVIAGSYKIPVLVDFWAEWCGPCRVLGPILERLSQQARGRWTLKKVNVEEFQDVATEYNVKGIPVVKLFKNGHPVAEFTGALPEIQVENWLKKNLPSRNDENAEQAFLFLDNGNTDKAKFLLEEILKDEPDHPISAFYLGQILLFENPETAAALFSISGKDPHFMDHSGYLKKLALLIKSKDQHDLFADHPVKPLFLEAIQALSRQDFDLALQRFIEVIMKNKSYENESAREACIALFYYLGTDHELTRKFRRRFDMALY
jgi:putative thioredoxin